VCVDKEACAVVAVPLRNNINCERPPRLKIEMLLRGEVTRGGKRMRSSQRTGAFLLNREIGRICVRLLRGVVESIAADTGDDNISHFFSQATS
jgi:hypothetical protein